VGTGKRLFDRFRAANDEMLSQVQRQRQSGLASGQSIFNEANVILGGLVLGAIALVVLLGLLLTRSIVRPLGQLQDVATRIRSGFLDTPVPLEGHDEIAQLAGDMDAMRAHLAAQRRIADLLASPLELDMIYPELSAELKRLVPFDRASVSIMSKSGTELLTVYAEGVGMDEFMVGSLRPVDESIFSRSVHTGEPVLIDETTGLQVEGIALATAGIRSVVMMPLRTKARMWGSLNLSSSNPQAFDQGTVSTLATLIQPLANAVENADLYHEIGVANKELERVNRLKSEFLANMSHELRTPLNAIIGFSEVLQDTTFGPLNDRQQRYVGNVLESGRHLLALVNDILDISKVEAGYMELHREILDVKSLVAEVSERIVPLANNKRITLQIEPCGEAPLINADRARFVQILINLLSNAIKFTPPEGTVSVSYEAQSQLVAIAVKDTGIGIPVEDQARIFDEFEQVDSSLGRTQEGTGLGLALTKRLVELHGGTIGVQSAPGEGSTFTVTVPRAEPETAVNGTRGVVLVVEDDAAARELLSVYLASAGYGVQSVDRVAEVLPRALQTHPVAITLDLALKNEMGWPALEQLKAHPETRAIPVVIVSILDEEQLGFALGASAYLNKPVSRQELLQVVERLAGEKSRTSDQPIRVLAVDDQPEALELIALALEGSRYRLMQASNGADALELLASQDPDLLIVDLVMEPLSGFDVIEAVVADPKTRHIPIVVWTARDLTSDDIDRLNGHVAARISKRDFGVSGKEAFLRELERVIGRAPEEATADAGTRPASP
jgi:signal transduction histidine kinase/CheY-like chemotaxis protein